MLMTRDVVQSLIDAGIRAPSGENCQPWRFVVKGDSLTIFNIPERDQSPYNFNQFGSFVAHGALVENIAIAAAALGYAMKVTPFPQGQPNATAAISFTKAAPGKKNSGDLYSAIFDRVTNRTPYRGEPLEEKIRDILLSLTGEGGVTVRLQEDPQARKELGDALSYGDRLLFENRHVHDFLFSHIYWSVNAAAAHKSGFYVKELGLAGPQEAVFKLLRGNALLHIFNAIGFPGVAAKGNSKLYATSPAIGAIVTKGNAPADFLNAGRLMERAWLTATRSGYDIQPVTAIAFFMQRVLAGGGDVFSESQREGIRRSYAVLERAFDAAGGTIAMTFRIGKGKPLPARSLRMNASAEYL